MWQSELECMERLQALPTHAICSFPQRYLQRHHSQPPGEVMNNLFVRNNGHFDNEIDFAANKNDLYLSPKELADKVTEVHLRALGAALNVLTQEQATSCR